MLVGIRVTVQSIGWHRAGAWERLPDLEQETPSQLEVSAVDSAGTRTYLLGFRSAVSNVGDGPLIIDGRVDRGCSSVNDCAASMTADQLVEVDGGSPKTVSSVGRMRFVSSPDHDHWHLMGFDRYELRRAGSAEALVRDRKSGFCLGDRYEVRTRWLSAAPQEPVYTGRCGLGSPNLAHVREGISVGFGDDYAAYLEYQDLSLDGLPNGRYVLVHEVNVERRIKEMSYANNAASLLFDLRWQAGEPYVRVIAACPGSDDCARGG
jgi:Lysyl oxidase